ncbi:MAG: F0F1 ATP synthase subunit B [Pseudomonadota bacterium]
MALSLDDAKFWVAVALFLFLIVIFIMGAPGLITRGLDGRADRIRKEIEDARKLREEAQALLASYERKQREAEQEAQEIIEQAKKEADLLREETSRAMKEQAERRTAMAQQKIAQVEANAVKEVRTTAATIAVGAAQAVLAEEFSGQGGQSLIDAGIQSVAAKLN